MKVDEGRMMGKETSAKREETKREQEPEMTKT